MRVFLVHISTNLGISSDQLVSDVGLTASGDSSTIVVFEYENTALLQVELGAADLILGLLLRVECEFLRHLLDDNFSLELVANVMVVNQFQILVGNARKVRVEGYAAVNQLILATLISLEGLATNDLLAVDQAILVTMVVEINLADLSIDLNYLLPVVRRGRAVVALHQLELIGEPSSEDEVVFAILVVAAYFLNDQTLEVFIYGNAAD